MDPQRLVLVRTGDPNGSGSGYLVGPRLVLTALHVVLREGRWARKAVARVGHAHYGAGPVEVAARVCWPDPRHGAPSDSALDVALLWLEEPVPTDGPPIRWGRPGGVAPLPFEGAGFPAFAAGSDGTEAQCEYLRGALPAVSTTSAGWVLDCPVWPAPHAGSERPWAGASGSAIFCHGRLVGVVAEDNRTMGWRRLQATPVHEAVRLPDFANLVSRHGHPGTATVVDELTAQGVAGAAEATMRDYLQAARKAGEQHPYQNVLGPSAPPSLVKVFVHQRSSRVSRDQAVSRGDDAAAARRPPRAGAPAERVETIFRRADRMCVLIAGPGGGKSTTLRMRLRDAAAALLDGVETAEDEEPAVPVWVSARTLAGEETQVAEAVADATRKLRGYGRCPGFPEGPPEPPWPGAHWQLLVDDLDELATAAERRTVLEKLANAVTSHPSVYRCVIATRPLAENELSVLDRQVPHYELQPFTPDDLNNYAEQYFGARWSSPEAARRARQFTRELRTIGMEELARTPLMAFMLCQLYVIDPERTLPDGRTAAYEAFTDLLYENNESKRVADSHEASIARLVESVQSARAREEADAAARQVHVQLPELIEYVAHGWFTGRESSVPQALAAHEAVRRPGKVRPERWEAFLEDLFLHTGLLVHRAGGLGFPHRTFLEYHAARYATRHETARAQLLHELFPDEAMDSPPKPPDLPVSYLGFLLDGLLSADDSIATEATRRVGALAEHGEMKTLSVLMTLVAGLKTKLPVEPLIRRLRHLIEHPSIYDPLEAPVYAAWWLTHLDGNVEAGAEMLTRFAQDDGNRVWERVKAMGYLGRLEGHQDVAAAWLTGWVQWKDWLDVDERVAAAEALAWIEGHRETGAAWLVRFTEDTGCRMGDRLTAARALVAIPEHRASGAAWLARFSEDTAIDDDARLLAAWQLACMEEYEKTGATLLSRFVEDTAFGGSERVCAAWGLARLDGSREVGLTWLRRFAEDSELGEEAVQRLRELTKDTARHT
ncbi:trypsin-like peptidase domain-containing protein [Streptomyces sp. NPDC052101]|uniref:trypsin-like peptidase domain-containing protein n=1 Tax=Streptomyces sp. NPDC052101 TaxID=3155763 RepID=UPI003424E8F0